MNNAKTILQMVSVVVELTNTPMTDLAKAAMVEDLLSYDFKSVEQALLRCRREVQRGRFTLAEVINRIDDGRPGPDEAWAEICKGEDDTLVWCEEMAEARGIVAELIAQGDKVAARMAFKEAYARLLVTARSERRPAKFTVSLGHDKSRHALALAEAVRRGLLPLAQVEQYHRHLLPQIARLAGVTDHPLLAAPDVDGLRRLGNAVKQLTDKRVVPDEPLTDEERDEGHRRLSELSAKLGKKVRRDE